MSAVTRVMIAKFVTRDRILGIEDMLSLEPRRSRIRISIAEFNPETHKVEGRAVHYAQADEFKLACYDIVNGLFTEWNDHKGSFEGVEPPTARVLALRKDVKYRQPFVLKLDNGDGERLPDGKVKMIHCTDSLTVLISERDARRLAMTVHDYIRDWEIVNFRRRQEALTVIVPDHNEKADTE